MPLFTINAGKRGYCRLARPIFESALDVFQLQPHLPILPVLRLSESSQGRGGLARCNLRNRLLLLALLLDAGFAPSARRVLLSSGQPGKSANVVRPSQRMHVYRLTLIDLAVRTHV